MKIPKHVHFPAWAVFSISVLLATAALGSNPLTLLVIPDRYTITQVAFDVADRYPTILVSYQGDASTDSPLLYAWNGTEWVFVSMEDYESSRFLQNKPSRIVLVGDNQQLPGALIDASSWSPTLLNVTAMETPAFVQALGEVYKFNQRDWSWFAGRYNLEVVDVNAPRRHTSWYDGKLIERRTLDGRGKDVYVPPGGEVVVEDLVTYIEATPADSVVGSEPIEEVDITTVDQVEIYEPDVSMEEPVAERTRTEKSSYYWYDDEPPPVK